MVGNKIIKKIVGKPIVKKNILVKPVVVKSVVKPVFVKPVVSGKIEKIEIGGIQDILKIVGNKDYFEIYGLISKMDENFFSLGFSGSFYLKKEVNDFFQERILDFLKEVYSDLKFRISQLRKKGNEVNYIDFEVLSIPLKMKILKADFSFGNFLKIKELIDLVERELSGFKIGN